MKRVLAVLSLLLLAGAGCATTSTNEGSNRATVGVITSINMDAIALDGPTVITIRNAEGETEEIQVPSFGLLLCEGGDNIADVFVLNEGDQIEVNGTLSEEGAIVPCESSDHYLRVQE